MVTHLEAEDLPEPWFLPKQRLGRSSKQKSTTTKETTIDDVVVENAHEEQKKRVRGRPKGKSRIV